MQGVVIATAARRYERPAVRPGLWRLTRLKLIEDRLPMESLVQIFVVIIVDLHHRCIDAGTQAFDLKQTKTCRLRMFRPI